MKNDSSKVRLNLLCLVALSTVCLLAGCGSSERARLTGRWEIAEAGKLSSRIGNGEDSEPGQSKMTVLFENSGKLSTDTAMGNINSTKQGTWRMIDYDESKNRMQIECTLGLQTTEHEIDFEDDGSIVWIPPNLAGTSQKVGFVRAKN